MSSHKPRAFGVPTDFLYREAEIPDAAYLHFLAVPGPTYKALSDLAARQNKTVAELIQRAFSEFLTAHGVRHD